MSVYTGKNAKVSFGTDTILNLSTWTLTIESPLLGEPVFGDEWSVVAGQGIKSATGSLSGLLDTGDTTGQNEMESAAISGTKVVDLRLYVNTTDYWTSDTGADTDAGVYFTNYNASAGANEITKVSCDFSFHGKVHRTS